LSFDISTSTVHLDICEGVCVKVVGNGMADPPLLVAQAGEVKVEPGWGRFSKFYHQTLKWVACAS